MRGFICLVIISGVLLSCHQPETAKIVVDQNLPDEKFNLKKTTINIPQANLDSALYVNDMGYRQVHRDKFDVNNQGKTVREYKAIVLENAFIKLTLLPRLGKPYSLIYKVTGHEAFFIPETAHIHWSPNKLGWWFMLGGVEYVMPDKEHGDTWATDWDWEITENSDNRKTVRLRVKEKRYGLREAIDISIVPDKSYYIAEINIANPTDSTVHFQHWVNPMWAPGGQGEITPKTEFIMPTENVYVTDKKFNNWMLEFHPEGNRHQSYKDHPIRYLKNWKGMGDLLARKLEEGYYSAFSHEQNEGIVRVFPLDKNSGCNIWAWGADPKTRLRKLFAGDSTNRGYVEMWGGITKGFDKYYALEAGKSIAWTEWMYPYHGTRGLHFAGKDLAVTFFKREEENNGQYTYQLNICPAGKLEGVTLKIIEKASGKTLKVIDFKSGYPKKQLPSYEIVSASENVELVILKDNQVVKRLEPGSMINF